jgi:hypothetical protein
MYYSREKLKTTSISVHNSFTWPFLLVFLVVVEITPTEAVLGGGGGGGAGGNTEAHRNHKI